MFVTRLISGIVLVAIALLAFIFGGEILLGISVFISIAGYLELCRAVGVKEKDKKINALEIVGIIGILAYYAVLYFFPAVEEGNAAMSMGNVLYAVIPVIGVFMLSMLLYVVCFPKYRSEQIMANVFNFLYAPVMLSFIYLTREQEAGKYIVWLILISSWGCDTCAYVVGMLIGKKKIFPVLSPKKSLEGCIGGVVGAGLIAALYAIFAVENVFPDKRVTIVITVICMVGAVMSQVGDLAASAIKRNHEIKDYGKLIPGHGGIMDRFDSVIVTAPMIYFLTVLFL
ncbi:MAG: phosphatidate cytidylyltransferase [Lachnospiraceae bacterium]|jgi:phosphatidate cytidylyltransferase|nr:phosphatidate cytidylyltransferase [Lachnospiraceae bacterium]